jgi:hypothetical protein
VMAALWWLWKTTPGLIQLSRPKLTIPRPYIQPRPHTETPGCTATAANRRQKRRSANRREGGKTHRNRFKKCRSIG